MLLFFLLSLGILGLAKGAGQCPPGYNYNQSANKCYRSHHNETVVFMHAQRICTASGGSIATIPNAFANSFLLSHLVPKNKYYHIGINTLSWPYAPNATRWLDGTGVGFTNWDAGQPKGALCGAMDSGTGKWVSSSCANNFTFICSADPVCPSPETGTSCESGWTFFDKTASCYKTFLNQNFDGAQNICQASGSNLTSVGSAEENQFLVGLTSTGLALTDTQQVWIGVRKQDSTWVNSDGSNSTYTNWGPGYPSTSTTTSCAILYADPGAVNSNMVSLWQDVSCGVAQRAFVCKKKAK